MTFELLKGLHIIFVVTWFAGLFYLVRLLIYHVEAADKGEVERNLLHGQFSIMEKRLYYAINVPSMILTLVFGIWMLIRMPEYLSEPWMHVKLTLVFFLIGYHHMAAALMKKAWKGNLEWTSKKLRVFNEVATLFLILIVLLATVGKGNGMQAWAMYSGVVLAILVALFYFVSRKKKKAE